MISDEIIIVTEYTDYSASFVLQWLLYFKAKAVRINSEEKNLTIQYFRLGNVNHETNLRISSELTFDDHNKRTIWFRRGYINFLNTKINVDTVFKKSILNTGNNRQETINHLNDEYSSLKTGVYDYICKNNNVIGNPIEYQANKLISLEHAKKSGLLIPDTLITTSKAELLKFYELHKKIITKGIQEAHAIRVNSNFTATYTKSITLDFINELPAHFIPSLFQIQIEKFIEIRVFIFEKLIYSMAIFSQNDKQTEVDFRAYNYKRPNRYVPFEIPKSISKKLFAFMKRMNLNSGSIDLVLTPQSKYYFLEVNPVGQFSFVSQECNYNIERDIANYLIKINES